jgi:hypothetical protein
MDGKISSLKLANSEYPLNRVSYATTTNMKKNIGEGKYSSAHAEAKKKLNSYAS